VNLRKYYVVSLFIIIAIAFTENLKMFILSTIYVLMFYHINICFFIFERTIHNYSVITIKMELPTIIIFPCNYNYKKTFLFFHASFREISRAISFRPFFLAKSKSVYVPSSIFNIHVRHTERLIRYLSAHFVDSVEIPDALRYVSYSTPCWHHLQYIHKYTLARTHTYTYTLSFSISIFLSLSICLFIFLSR